MIVLISTSALLILTSTRALIKMIVSIATSAQVSRRWEGSVFIPHLVVFIPGWVAIDTGAAAINTGASTINTGTVIVYPLSSTDDKNPAPLSPLPVAVVSAFAEPRLSAADGGGESIPHTAGSPS